MKQVTNLLQAFFLTCFLILAIGQTAQAAVKYVKLTASGTGDGSSWANASDDLQAMIDAAGTSQVWVAAGTYKPTSGTDRTVAFVMKNGVAILGGFPNTGSPGIGDRDWTANVTTLSGDIDGDNTLANNSYHVIFNDFNLNNVLNNTAILDGFSISGGNADGSSFPNYAGGGMFNNNNSPTVTNCSFSGNSAGAGGGMFNSGSSPTVTNCSFSGNSANFFGGGMANDISSPTVTNCSFSGNSANSGGGMDNSSSDPTVTNCILWGNSNEITNNGGGIPTVTYSIVQGGYSGTGNLDEDPLFASQPPIGLGTSGDLRLQASSCAIDNGLDSAVPTGVITDLDGNPRFYNGGQVDIGAYEFQGNYQAPAPIIIPPTTANNGLHFDGTDDHVKVFSDCGSNTLFPGGDAITVEYWFKGTNSQSAVRLQNGNNYIITAITLGSNQEHLLSNDGGVSAGTGFYDGNWHHLAFTWQRNTPNGFTSFLDGQIVEQRQSSNFPLPAFNTGFYLGSQVGSSQFTSGTLDEVRIWTVARTQAEIQESFCSGLSGPQPGLLHEFLFDHGTADGSNPGIGVVENTAFANAPGLLKNFALSGSTSNWVDNVLPAANCVSQTIQATLNANAQYTVDPNQLDENSTDACGILSLAASPAVLDCQHEGTNTVTLTVTDNNGNTASCTATIEVAEFLTLNPPTATAESCAGAGDGTVSLTATAGGGQVKYSIDGGATYQASGTFGNLSPGTYTIVVKVFGVPAVCEKTATATVAAGGSPTTWFKDTDGDGYTDGTTVTSCAQPTGYINNPLPGTDCNDYDPLAFPGQTWYEDLDGDGYGSGNTQTSCMRPAGCFTASELIAVDTDCDDSEATVNPAATEICDGLDNDCNGQIDEGLTGTYVGNVLFTTQAQLDAWLACYDVIQGSVTIQGGNIVNLAPLSNIVEITGNLTILMNSVLTSLDGLENLADVGGAFYMYYNFQLSDCCAVSGLLDNGGVAGPVLIFFNSVGCNSQAEIIGTCTPAPLVSNGNSITQNCSSCNSPRLLQVFPNPASHEINIHFNRHAPQATLRITDMLGRVVFTKELAEGVDRTAIDLGNENFKNGMYQVSLFENGETTTKQLVILR